MSASLIPMTPNYISFVQLWPVYAKVACRASIAKQMTENDDDVRNSILCHHQFIIKHLTISGPIAIQVQ